MNKKILAIVLAIIAIILAIITVLFVFKSKSSIDNSNKTMDNSNFLSDDNFNINTNNVETSNIDNNANDGQLNNTQNNEASTDTEDLPNSSDNINEADTDEAIFNGEVIEDKEEVDRMILYAFEDVYNKAYKANIGGQYPDETQFELEKLDIMDRIREGMPSNSLDQYIEWREENHPVQPDLSDNSGVTDPVIVIDPDNNNQTTNTDNNSNNISSENNSENTGNGDKKPGVTIIPGSEVDGVPPGFDYMIDEYGNEFLVSQKNGKKTPLISVQSQYDTTGDEDEDED